MNHPFVDGNKRTGFAVTYTFLAIYGYKITAPPQETYRFIITALQAGRFEHETLANWLQKHGAPL